MTLMIEISLLNIICYAIVNADLKIKTGLNKTESLKKSHDVKKTVSRLNSLSNQVPDHIHGNSINQTERKAECKIAVDKLYILSTELSLSLSLFYIYI